MLDKCHFASMLKHHCKHSARRGGGGGRDEGQQLLTHLVGQMQDRSPESKAVCKALAHGGTGAVSLGLAAPGCVTWGRAGAHLCASALKSFAPYRCKLLHKSKAMLGLCLCKQPALLQPVCEGHISSEHVHSVQLPSYLQHTSHTPYWGGEGFHVLRRATPVLLHSPEPRGSSLVHL